MMKLSVFLPLIIPFTAGLLLLGFRTKETYQKTVSFIASLGLLAAALNLLFVVKNQGIQVAHLGNWPSPFGIILAVDLLGAIMTVVCGSVGLTALFYSFPTIQKKRMDGAYYALFFFLLFGINGAFMTGDLFNLFVFFEVVLMTSYVLLVLGNEHKQAASGFTYLTLNLVGSTLFLAGAGIIFGQLGTLNMAHIASRIGTIENQGLVTLVGMIFFCVFGIKAAMFPLYNWLPDSYTAPPTPISAVFAGLLTKVGVYSMYRAFGTMFIQDIGFTHHNVLILLAGLTMVLGVWGAVVQYDVRSILAFHSISQVGYILMGLAIFTPLAIAGGIYHMVHHSLIKSSLFLIGGGMGHIGGTQDLKKLGGLVKKSSALAIFFMISSMALSGIPPLSGFYSKLALVVSGLAEKHPILVTAALVTSLFTLYSMIKIWRLGFWGETNTEKESELTPSPKTLQNRLWTSLTLSVAFVIYLSLFAGPVMKICKDASEQLFNQKEYIEAVLNSRPVPYPARDKNEKP